MARELGEHQAELERRPVEAYQGDPLGYRAISIIECSSSDEAELLDAHVQFLVDLLKGAEDAK